MVGTSKGRVKLTTNNAKKKMQVPEAFDIPRDSTEWADHFLFFPFSVSFFFFRR